MLRTESQRHRSVPLSQCFVIFSTWRWPGKTFFVAKLYKWQCTSSPQQERNIVGFGVHTKSRGNFNTNVIKSRLHFVTWSQSKGRVPNLLRVRRNSAHTNCRRCRKCGSPTASVPKLARLHALVDLCVTAQGHRAISVKRTKDWSLTVGSAPEAQAGYYHVVRSVPTGEAGGEGATHECNERSLCVVLHPTNQHKRSTHGTECCCPFHSLPARATPSRQKAGKRQFVAPYSFTVDKRSRTAIENYIDADNQNNVTTSLRELCLLFSVSPLEPAICPTEAVISSCWYARRGLLCCAAECADILSWSYSSPFVKHSIAYRNAQKQSDVRSVDSAIRGRSISVSFDLSKRHLTRHAKEHH